MLPVFGALLACIVRLTDTARACLVQAATGLMSTSLAKSIAVAPISTSGYGF